LNPRPTDYESVALPLSYVGKYYARTLGRPGLPGTEYARPAFPSVKNIADEY
jgi:hypothetical protein